VKEMKEAKKRLQFSISSRLSVDDYNLLTASASSRGVSAAKIIRDIIKEALNVIR
jgi:hypothetical protein